MTLPKHPSQRRRRNATLPMTQLPIEGRKGKTPAWPLDEPPSPEELKVWRELWRTPAAIIWERMRWTRTVARYARILVRAEVPGAGRDAIAAAVNLEDRLGLTPQAMIRLRWEILPDEVAQARADRAAPAPAPRLRAVDPDAVAGS